MCKQGWREREKAVPGREVWGFLDRRLFSGLVEEGRVQLAARGEMSPVGFSIAGGAES